MESSWSDSNQLSAWKELEAAYECLSPLDRGSFKDRSTCRALFERGPKATVLSRFSGHLEHFSELRDVDEGGLVEALQGIASSWLNREWCSLLLLNAQSACLGEVSEVVVFADRSVRWYFCVSEIEYWGVMVYGKDHEDVWCTSCVPCDSWYLWCQAFYPSALQCQNKWLYPTGSLD